MNPNQIQPNNMTPEEAKASLGIATALQDKMLPQNPNPDQGVPSNQQTTQDVSTQIQGLETRIMDEISTIKEEMKGEGDKGKKDLSDLKKSIEQILNG